MNQLICGRDEEFAQWAEDHYPDCAPLLRPLTSIGVVSDSGDVRGVAIFHNYRQNDIEVTFITATPRWATQGVIRGILDYPFRQLGVKRMTAITKTARHLAPMVYTLRTRRNG